MRRARPPAALPSRWRARRLQPEIVREIGVELRRDEARLREQLAGALAQDCRSLPRSGSKRTTASATSSRSWCRRRRRCRRPLFQVISAGVDVERDQRIGEARAVHVQRQAVLLRHGGNRRDVVERVDRADLGRLRDRHRHRLAGGRKIVREARDGAFERLRVDAAQRAGTGAMPRAAGEKSQRAEFVDDHMRLAVAEGDAADAVAGGHRESVGRRAGGDEEDRDLALENFAEASATPLCRVRHCHRRVRSRLHVPRGWRRSSDARPPNCPMQKSRVLIPRLIGNRRDLDRFFSATSRARAAEIRDASGGSRLRSQMDRKLRASCSPTQFSFALCARFFANRSCVRGSFLQ